MEDAANGSHLLAVLDEEFSSVLSGLENLTNAVPDSLLYQHPPIVSIGENILRSAGVVEQTFGGLTANLWDDPFEWTLPESLSTSVSIAHYLHEVDDLRRQAFESFATDVALTKLVAVPSGEARPLLKVLITALARAAEFRGCAVATFKILSDKTSNRFII